MKRIVLPILSTAFVWGLWSSSCAAQGAWDPVAKALGRSGTEMPGGVYRVGLGRSDLKVTLDGVQVRPALALGSYLAFQRSEERRVGKECRMRCAQTLRNRK